MIEAACAHKGDCDEATDQILGLFLSPEEVERKIKDTLKDDYAKFIEIPSIKVMLRKLAQALSTTLKPTVDSICSAHMGKPDKDCKLCKIHFPFSIDTDKYCKSAGYVKPSWTELEIDVVKKAIKQAEYDMAGEAYNSAIATHHLRALVNFCKQALLGQVK
jgi:hypothetical protein